MSLQSAQFFEQFCKADTKTFYFPEDLEQFLAEKSHIDLAIPVFHGHYGEDGMIFAFLQTLGIQTAFSGFETHAICLDKYKTNILVESLHIACPKQVLISKNDILDTEKIETEIGFPLILKPNNGGSSFFTYKIENFAELTEKLDFVFSKTDENMLVCEYIL